MKLRQRLYSIFCQIFKREIIRDGYRGILGRDPEAEALDAYAGSFKGLGADGVIRDVLSSQEAWENQKKAHVEELMSSVYQGVSGKIPDEKMLSELIYQYKLCRNNKLDRSIRNLIESNIGWEELFVTHSEKIVTELYRGVFDRYPDQVGYRAAKAVIEKELSLIGLLSSFSRSEELWSQLRKKRRDLAQNSSDKLVFIHVEKTGGTSMQKMLLESGRLDIYHEHTSTLSNKSNNELNNFNIYIGHFQYDEVKLKLPNSKLFSMIREPRSRLVSLYNFWRAHKTTHPSFWRGMELANEYKIKDFFQLEEIKTWPAIWNHMTYALLGKSIWNEWLIQASSPDAESSDRWLTTEIKKKIQERLYDYRWIGLLENIEKDAPFILKQMGIETALNIKHEHSLAKITSSISNTRKDYSPQYLNDGDLHLLNAFVGIDEIIYNMVKFKNKRNIKSKIYNNVISQK
jgi:hypothetical protein